MSISPASALATHVIVEANLRQDDRGLFHLNQQSSSTRPRRIRRADVCLGDLGLPKLDGKAASGSASSAVREPGE